MRHIAALLSGLVLAGAPPCYAGAVDLRQAVVVIRPGRLANAERAAASVLIEEMEKRSGIRLAESTTWPEGKTVIAITSESGLSNWGHATPASAGKHAEGYRLYIEEKLGSPSVIWVIGADPRGTLFAAGNLLRKLDWAKGKLSLSSPLDIATAPVYPIRGHQLGYRTQANSYDAWNAAQFEQYIRELAFFGVNSIEGIPFHDDRKTPVMKVPRREMNRAISEICDRYGLDYWVWVPADFDLRDSALRGKMLRRYEEFFKDSKEVTGVFFPGGDPGSNPPELVLPFLEDVAKLMRPLHAKARIWISLQWFTAEQVDFVYKYIERETPEWLGGLVAGPSSPPVPQTRLRLPARYKLRLYPDLTHNKICQYQVPGWDQALALTLGREAINPRPAEFASIHNRVAPYGDGFISYSDGVHDDVNKTIWSAMSWDPSRSVLEILVDYARVYFDPSVAEEAADGILALEKNWRGPLIDNGAVDATLLLWQKLESKAPQLEKQWRWQMCLLRANYDAYVRRRLIHETGLESQANAILAQAGIRGTGAAMSEAMDVLNRVVTQSVSADLRRRIVDLCEELFHSIGLQTSVDKYFASGEERGAVLDFVDYPLNNRWWLEDEFKKVRALGSASEKASRLHVIATWEHPGRGSFYDNVGNASKSPHVVRNETEDAESALARPPQPTFWWWDEGKSRARLTWQATMWPRSMVYEGLDPNASYVVRSTGYGQALLRLNGERVEPAVDGNEMGEFKEFAVPSKYVKDRKLTLTWDRPMNEGGLNWRKRSRLAEVWLLRKD
jgi:hypothetical protein